MYKIFVSYSFHDQSTADRFWGLRRPPQVGVFVAQHAVPFGKDIPDDVAAALRQCNLFVLLWSSNARDSEWVQHELGMARALGKDIIPVQLEPDFAPPTPIRDLRYMPFHENPDGWTGWFHQLANDVVRKRATTQSQVDWKAAGAGLLAGLGLAWLASQGKDDDDFPL